MPTDIFQNKILEARILERVSKNEITGCWLWTGYVGRDGYGQMSVDNKKTSTHRIMYQIKNGLFAAGMMAGHICDDKYPKDCKLYRTCCNPDHIKPMTAKQNSGHAFTIGRLHNQQGQSNNRSKLTKEQVIEIRRRKDEGIPYGGHKKLAEEFGIAYSTLHSIIHGEIWSEPEYFPAST